MGKGGPGGDWLWLLSSQVVAIEAGWCLLVLLQLLFLPGRPLGHDMLLEVEGSRTKRTSERRCAYEGMNRRSMLYIYVCVCKGRVRLMNERNGMVDGRRMEEVSTGRNEGKKKKKKKHW